ncbi:ATP-dependent protease subunit ClpQ, putative [Plasmodium chabaudi chabaudi]|uniref:ATP-dependent protease subunit ClpQ, putative n=2 Tax=Plasmodium chabaudi TaxID=5825 RepID=A0A077TRM6_PLACU|nr:ATP-dependent protease subunit ClpQ, putative [Plasmodium chabaudi chabaudi]SCM25435.1 ATP-dependent protease subunit ClpQ, putative [Plasmodium chabaudi adami]SCM26643.1 ATP-dependent protease subunit ClpQ, putative [Plasmodium chabaudi chabaudi]SCN63349.1 ATP-dependent protease subunit ClpQ, putative [Plasmodium chabaudi adami]SCN63389.1 ATP-dependent protease subunit ClpQ, putative [Plasmodium chabaudi chabaudi]VTZ71148.1 ATP-dependent protease subunit ClpQ, putative [Plasmodium chabaudi|eukprot:XP_016655008.1 ATP-dependent protease subunit ClpQ, putative [Plasmodium chabaudi chabaudi]
MFFKSLSNIVKPRKQITTAIQRSYFSDSGKIVIPRHGTTILCVRKNNEVCLIGDGMVSQGTMIVKGNAKKIRRLKDNILMGFAGATADCFTLLDKFETKIDEYPNQLLRSCVELAKLWRTDRYLRHLEAVLIVADKDTLLEVTGNGDVLEPSGNVLGTGSGGPYAIAAARALYDIENLSAKDIAYKAMNIAADMCCHTNHNFICETL